MTGALHLGHALNNTLQDILIRQKRMQGFETLWMPGTDHAGIATQAVVERRLLTEEKISRHDLGREGLVERIWQWKKEYEARILGQLKRMGCSCDWQRTRFTLDDTCARAVRETFFKLFKDGKIYRGKRLVNWDTFLQTAVSDDEVFHETVDGHFWYFKYPVIDPKPGEPTHVTVATTRPETMLGDTAVAVHPDPAAALDKAEADLNERLAAAPAKDKPAIRGTNRRSAAASQGNAADAHHAPRHGRWRAEKSCCRCRTRKFRFVADDWAKPELGTGCVKITPAHDPNDYEVGLRNNLPMVNILNPDGTLSAEAGKYQGLSMADAREKVVADLEALGLGGKDRGPADRNRPQRPQQNAHRAVSDRPVVRQNGRTRPIGDGRRDRRPREDHSRTLRQRLSSIGSAKNAIGPSAGSFGGDIGFRCGHRPFEWTNLIHTSAM